MLSICFLLSYFLFVLKILNQTKQLTPPTYEKTRSYLNKRFQSLENILVLKTFQTKANVSNQDTFSIPDICLYPLANVPKAG